MKTRVTLVLVALFAALVFGSVFAVHAASAAGQLELLTSQGQPTTIAVSADPYTLTGSGFHNGNAVHLRIEGQGHHVSLGQVTVSNGSFSLSIQNWPLLTPGYYNIVATQVIGTRTIHASMTVYSEQIQ